MTEGAGKGRKRGASVSIGMTRGELAFCIMSILALLLSFCFADTAIGAMSEGMKLCVSVVVPSLFPFMVFSDILVSSGGARLIAMPFSRLAGKLFGLSREGSVPLVLGILCGFPMGTRAALSLYSEGKISRGETEHLLCFCNGPSAAFLINAVGLSLFGSRDFGILLYCSQMLSSLVVGMLLQRHFKKKSGAPTLILSCAEEVKAKRGVLSSIVGAVTGASEGMVSICAFVIFFSALTGVLREILSSFGVSEAAEAALLGFFEMTGGVSAVSTLSLPLSCLLAAAIVGWSGLSIHCQLLTLGDGRGLSYRFYFRSKLAQALLCAIFVTIFKFCGFGLQGVFAHGAKFRFHAENPIHQRLYLFNLPLRTGAENFS
jgi:sporulation integral membrane protein YlbJ